MSDSTVEDRAIRLRAILRGGPADLPHAAREREVTADEQKVKVPWLGGYEHFEREPGAPREVGGAIVFHWTQRTRIAE